MVLKFRFTRTTSKPRHASLTTHLAVDTVRPLKELLQSYKKPSIYSGFRVFSHFKLPTFANQKNWYMKIGIIKEGKTPPDERVPFSPEQTRELRNNFPGLQLVVQESDVRRFTAADYTAAGTPVVDCVDDADVLMGVKEVPIEQLIPNKTYFFFSHTIKKQPYNRDLLRAVLAKNITLVDYECLVKDGLRIVGFGRYAGIVGAYNGLLAYGKRSGSFDLKPAHKCEDQNELVKELEKITLPSNFKIALTGRGRVAGGAVEVLEKAGIKRVGVKDYLTQSFEHPVYVQLAVTDYNIRKDGADKGVQDFFDHAEEYKSHFFRFAKVSDLYISGHFWKEGSPFIFTREDAKQSEFNIQVVADVSCDIDGPVACTLRPSTIDNPLYGYHPESESEVDFDREDAITVMAVDNLPCELPKDASRDFGKELLDKVIPELVNGDPNKIIYNATIAKEGKLNEPFTYLQDYVDGKE